MNILIRAWNWNSKPLDSLKKRKGPCEIAQTLRTLATKPIDLSSVPRTHMVGENQLLQVIFWSEHAINKCENRNKRR